MRRPVYRTIVVAFLLSTSTPPPGKCARTTVPQINNDTSDDYDIHIPLSAIPLGVNIGPSLEVLSFAKDAKTGELPWVARRGWLEVGDVLVSLVSLEGEYMSEFSPGDFADAMRKILESRQTKPGQQGSDSDGDAGEFITLRVRPGGRPGRATRNHGMYSPMTKGQADQQARWYLSYSTGPLSAGKVDVTLAAFGSVPDGCDALPVVMAIPEDGCLPLRNAQKAEGAHVLVRRGGCSFLAKAITVSNSGGRSLVVVDEGAGRLRMEADQGEAAGIPVVMVSKQDGESLQNMAVSTSRATGKITASLVVTAACLPKRTAPPHPAPSRQASSQLERRGRRLSAAGASPVPSRLKESNAENEAPSAEAVRPAGVGTEPSMVKLAVDKAGTEKQSDAPRSSTSTRGERPGAAAAEVVVVGAAGGQAKGGGVHHNVSPRCRERSSGKLRGGDLILSSATGSGASHISVEFLSTFVTGPLSIQQLAVASTEKNEDASPGDDTPALVVTIPSGACKNPALKDGAEATRAMATTNGARTIMLLPPDADCPVERQISLGEKLGAAVLVVIAAADDDDANITPLVSSATDIIFTRSGVTGDTVSPGYNGSPTTLGSPPPPPALGGSQNAERVGGNAAYDGGGRDGGAPNGDGDRRGTVDQRQRLQKPGGGDEDRRERSRGGCPPLTIVVGHDEGKRVLEWLGGGAVTASVVEREDVGRLWGDVVWASDPANWPKGFKTRRRILNRLRKTHSPEHAGRGGDEDGTARRKASAARWSLIERYGKAAEEGEDDARPSTPVNGRLDTEL